MDDAVDAFQKTKFGRLREKATEWGYGIRQLFPQLITHFGGMEVRGKACQSKTLKRLH